MTKLKLLLVLAVLVLSAASASANSIPTRSRSSYGDAASTVLVGPTDTTTDGLTIASEEFCSDALINTSTGTCQVSYAFQITSPVPAGQSLVITLPLPSGATLAAAGLLTNDFGSSVFNLPYSPFSESDVLALSPSAIVPGTDSAGDPTFTFTLPITLPGNGEGLTLYMDVLNSNTSVDGGGGNYCYVTTSGSCTEDLPGLVTPGISLTSGNVPEPASLSLLLTGLIGLGGLYRQRRKS